MAEQEYDKEQLRILRNAFKAFDHDEKGSIEYADVQQILEILGQKLDDKAVKNLIKEVDKANTGKLDFNQFCKLAARFVEVEEDTTNLASELKEAFRVYDKEGKGYLTVQTLRDILHELDDKLSSQDLDMIIDEIDADGSGTVDFDEFMQVMTGKDFQDIVLQHRFSFDTKPITKCSCPGHRMFLHRRIESIFQEYFEQLLHRPVEWLFITRPRARSCVRPIPPPKPKPKQSPSPSPSPKLRPSSCSPRPISTTSRPISASRPTSVSRPASVSRPTSTSRPASSLRPTPKPSTCTTSSPRSRPSAAITRECTISSSSTVKLPSVGSSITSTCTTSRMQIRKTESKPSQSTVKISNVAVFNQPTKCIHRQAWRTQFPKWIPVLTLYREVLQNPLRCRARYMITHN